MEPFFIIFIDGESLPKPLVAGRHVQHQTKMSLSNCLLRCENKGIEVGRRGGEGSGKGQARCSNGGGGGGRPPPPPPPKSYQNGAHRRREVRDDIPKLSTQVWQRRHLCTMCRPKSNVQCQTIGGDTSMSQVSCVTGNGRHRYVRNRVYEKYVPIRRHTVETLQ